MEVIKKNRDDEFTKTNALTILRYTDFIQKILDEDYYDKVIGTTMLGNTEYETIKNVAQLQGYKDGLYRILTLLNEIVVE